VEVHLPDNDTLLRDCAAILTENRCAEFCTDLCAEARKRGIPVIVRCRSRDVDARRLADRVVASDLFQRGLAGHRRRRDDAMALRKIAKLTPSFLAGTRGPRGTSGSTSARS